MTETFAADAVDESPSDSKKKLMILGGVAGVLVLGAAGFHLLHGGGGTSDANAGFPVHKGIVHPAITKKTTTTKKVTALTKLPTASTVEIGRDPFKALYVVPVATTAPASTQPTGTASTAPVTTTPGGGTATTPATAPVATTYALKLVRVYGSGKDTTGVFSLAGKQVLAKQGTSFGKSGELKVLSLQQTSHGVWTATIQVGDDNPFDSVTGIVYYVA